jgi:hypothetical protein
MNDRSKVIEHVGILGMKWGVRRNLTPSTRHLSTNKKTGQQQILTRRYGDHKIIRRKVVTPEQAKKFMDDAKKMKYKELMKQDKVKKAAKVVSTVISAYLLMDTVRMISGMTSRSSDTYNAAYTQWLRTG